MHKFIKGFTIFFICTYNKFSKSLKNTEFGADIRTVENVAEKSLKKSFSQKGRKHGAFLAFLFFTDFQRFWLVICLGEFFCNFFNGV